MKKFFIVLLIVLLIAIPKSGVTFGGIPLNTIYLLIAMSAPLLFLRALVRPWGQAVTLPRNYSIYIAGCFPFWMIFFSTSVANGIANFSILFGYVAALLVCPLYFYLLSMSFQGRQISLLLRTFKWCIRFIVVFGLALFFWKLTTGKFFEIPFVTTTYGAEKNLSERMNQRGEIFKLFSTYNNGNIFSVCLVMMLPLYRLVEKHRLFMIMAFSAVVLSLSRTAWALLVVYFLIEFMSGITRLTPTRLMGIALVTVGFLASIGSVLDLMQRDSSFIFDESLGGRASYFAALSNVSLLGNEPLQNVYEIPYLSIMQHSGVLAVLLMLALFMPSLEGMRSDQRHRHPVVRSAWHGCVLYLTATLSDAAIIFVPVFAIYSLLVMLFYVGHRLPAEAVAKIRS